MSEESKPVYVTATEAIKLTNEKAKQFAKWFESLTTEEKIMAREVINEQFKGLWGHSPVYNLDLLDKK